MATAEFHNRAKAVYRANVDEIGHHLIKQTHVMIAIERHDAHSDALPKDKYLWVKGRRVSHAVPSFTRATRTRRLTRSTRKRPSSK